MFRRRIYWKYYVYSIAREDWIWDYIIQLNLAVIYYTGYEAIERNYKAAACLLEKYIEIEPNSADALHLLGRCYLFMENRDLSKAESLFVKAAA